MNATNICAKIEALQSNPRKIECLKTSKPSNLTINDVCQIIRCFDSDPYKTEAIGVLKEWISGTIDSIAMIVNEINWDSYKFEVIQILSPKILEPITSVSIRSLFEVLCYDERRVEIVRHLSPKIKELSCAEVYSILSWIRSDAYRIEILRLLKINSGDKSTIIQAVSGSYRVEAMKILGLASNDTSPGTVILHQNCDTQIRELKERLREIEENKNMSIAMLKSQLDSRLDCKQNDKNKCAVCLENDKCMLLNECKHACLCESCIPSISKDGMIVCPLCRIENKSHTKIFI